MSIGSRNEWHGHKPFFFFGGGVTRDGLSCFPRFWRLAQALSALYPPSTEEKRWVNGVLGRKNGLGF